MNRENFKSSSALTAWITAKVYPERLPSLHCKITLIQIVVPSRENIPRSHGLRSEIEKLVSSENGEFTEPGWTSIQYIHRSGYSA